jgi:hypothetical protein
VHAAACWVSGLRRFLQPLVVVSRRVDHLRRCFLSFVLLSAEGCGDECLQDPSPYAFDEPGPWGATPAQVFGDVEGPASGTLTWIGPSLEEDLDPALAKTEVSLELTFDTNSVAGIRNGLTCDGELEMDATMTIATADGSLDESIPLVLMAQPGSKHLTAIVDLTSYDFAGTLELTPGWTKHEMLLSLSWDGDGRLMGAMQTGDALDTQALQDPDTKSGVYALISASG